MFGNLGEMAGLMKKFGDIQKNLKQMKEELAKTEVSARDSSGRVEAVVSGDLELKRLSLDPELAKSGDCELIQAAFYEAVSTAFAKAKAESAQKLSEATGGIKIPGLI